MYIFKVTRNKDSYIFTNILATLFTIARRWKKPVNRQNVVYIGKVKIAQLCPTPCDSMDCSPTGYSVHGILQARILEGVAPPLSRGSFPPRDCTAGRFFPVSATKKYTYKMKYYSAFKKNDVLIHTTARINF